MLYLTQCHDMRAPYDDVVCHLCQAFHVKAVTNSYVTRKTAKSDKYFHLKHGGNYESHSLSPEH